jgi:hypothetical protein
MIFIQITIPLLLLNMMKKIRLAIVMAAEAVKVIPAVLLAVVEMAIVMAAAAAVVEVEVDMAVVMITRGIHPVTHQMWMKMLSMPY